MIDNTSNSYRKKRFLADNQKLLEATKVAINLIEHNYDRLEIVAALANVSVQCLISLKTCDAVLIDRSLSKTLKRVLEACQLMVQGRKFKLSPESAVSAAYALLSLAEHKKRSKKQSESLKYAAKFLISLK